MSPNIHQGTLVDKSVLFHSEVLLIWTKKQRVKVKGWRLRLCHTVAPLFRSKVLVVTSSSCRPHSGWRAFPGSLPSESQTVASCQNKRTKTTRQSKSWPIAWSAADLRPGSRTWTSQSVPPWPARRSRSFRSSCRFPCRGTRWRGRCGIPPGRNLERLKPDLSLQHQHWCAEKEEKMCDLWSYLQGLLTSQTTYNAKIDFIFAALCWMTYDPVQVAGSVVKV